MPETTENRNSINFKQSYQGQYIHQQSSFPLKIMNPKAQKKKQNRLQRKSMQVLHQEARNHDAVRNQTNPNFHTNKQIQAQRQR